MNEIINGRREITRLDVFERVATGLNMPDDARHLLGLAPAHDVRSGERGIDGIAGWRRQTGRGSVA
ncbi:hypothetical protein [Streptomyces sp. S186]|uniref:hypothetical protein n=1 Tax=Streptomyces sp. S186 TaxID=3434395 RepID=UPI003F66F60C